MSNLQPKEGYTSVGFGPAFLRPAESDKGYYELMRPIISSRNEGDRIVREQHGEAFGPIGVYREVKKGDRLPSMSEVASHSGPPLRMKTNEPNTNRPIELCLVWFPGMDEK